MSSERAAVVMPVGPGTDAAHLQDTLDSITHWMPGARVVAVNDTGDQAVQTAVAAPGLTWLTSGKEGSGTSSGTLHLVCCQGYRYVAEHLDVDVMVKMDTDAVVTGPAPDRDAVARFTRDPGVGMLGSFRTTCTGSTRSFESAATAITRETSRWEVRHKPAAHLVRRLVARARRHGYEMGEHVLGGTSFVSRACLDDLHSAGLLSEPLLGRAQVVEDHMLALCVRSLGYELGDFAVGDDPLALAWRGLPYPPEEVLAAGKKVAHSVSDWGEQREDDVRSAFRGHRTRQQL